MHIRTINKCKVIKRFSLCKKLYDINEILYIQEKDTEHKILKKYSVKPKNILRTYPRNCTVLYYRVSLFPMSAYHPNQNRS